MRFFVAFGVTAALMPLVGRLGQAAGLVDRPSGDALKIHDRAVPLVGGVAALLGAAVSLGTGGAWPGMWLAAGVVVALGAGLIDDARPLGPLPRLIAQAVAGACIGVSAAGGAVALIGASIVLAVACANAVNLVDGQDGLAGGLAVTAALGFAGAAVVRGDEAGAALALALAGGLVAFVAWNMSPFRIFLGNGGAYAVGALLAALGLLAIEADGWRGAATGLLCLMPLAFELVLTVARRVRAGDGLAAGDRLHSYDQMAARGYPRRGITVSAWVVGALTAGLGVGAAAMGTGAAVASAALLATVALLAARPFLVSPRPTSVEGG